MTWKKMFIGLVGMIAAVAGWSNPGVSDTAPIPKKDTQMPLVQLGAPPSPEDCAYLGIEDKKPFELADVDSNLIVVEIIGVYCPQCHKQRPHINRLFHRIQKDGALSKKVKFIGIAAGATPMEVAYLIKEAKIPYPVITDEKFEIHKKLGEPRTPFNVVTTRQGKVLWTHLGIIDNMDAFLSNLKSLAGKSPG